MNVVLGILFIVITTFANIALADTYVGGHFRKNGTYVSPYRKTTSDSSLRNNYSTKGNVNPHTGKKGYVNPYKYGR